MQLAYSSERSNAAKGQEIAQSVFWVASGHFDSVLSIVPPSGGSAVRSEISVFDGSGALANQVQVISPGNTVTTLALRPMLSGCKPVGGIGCAQLRVNSPDGTVHSLDVNNISRNGISTRILSQDHGEFYPLEVGSKRSPILAASNPGDQSAKFALRLFLGQRNPEVSKELLPGASLIVSLKDEFSEFLNPKLEKVRAYLRLRSRSPQPVVIALFDEDITPSVAREV